MCEERGAKGEGRSPCRNHRLAFIFLSSILHLLSSPVAHALEVVAGTGTAGFGGDGAHAASALLHRPQAVTLSPDGSLYIADAGNRRVRRIAPKGTIGTVAGNGSAEYTEPSGPVSGTSVALAFPAGLAVGGDGQLFIADVEGQRLFRLAPGGQVTTLAGTGHEEAAILGPLPEPSPLLYPAGLLADGEGALLVEMGSGRLLRFDAVGALSLVSEGIGAPFGLARDVDDAPLVADFERGRIYRIVNGRSEVTLSLPRPMAEDEEDLSALPQPTSVALGRDGSLYVAVPESGTVYRLSGDGELTPFLTRPQVSRPVGLAVTPDSRLLIADEGRHQVLAEPLPFPAPPPGDPDADGKVTVSDALIALRILVGDGPIQRRRFLASDVASPQGEPVGDRRITIADAIRILRRAVGLE